MQAHTSYKQKVLIKYCMLTLMFEAFKICIQHYDLTMKITCTQQENVFVYCLYFNILEALGVNRPPIVPLYLVDKFIIKPDNNCEMNSDH